MVKTSFQKLKNHLASFDKVVKVRTTSDAITEGSWDKKYLDIQKKEIFLDNDRLLEHIIYQEVMNIVMHANSVHVNVLPANNKCLMNDNLESEQLIQENDHLFKLLLSQDIVHICLNSLATLTNYAKMEQDYTDEYSENLVLKAELAKKEQIVEKKFFNEVILRCSRLENCNVNLELKLPHQKESFLNNRSFNNQNAPDILEFFKINEWQTKLDAKDVSIANLRKHIESLKGKIVTEKDSTSNNAKHSMSNANSKLICSTCNECMFDAIHDVCVLNFVNNVNVRQKFTIEGNRCPLTRITSTNVVPPKNPLPTKVATKTTSRRNNLEMLKDVTNKSSSSRSKGYPNCSLVFGLRLLQAYDRKLLSAYQLRSQVAGTVRFGNDQIAKIMGYGQFFDSDLEVAFRKHTCYICDLGKRKKHTHKPKAEDSIQEKIYLLQMDLYRPMRIQSINGRKYILVIVNDYSRYWNLLQLCSCKKAYRIYNKRTRLIIETIYVDFDDLIMMASEQFSLRPGPQLLTPGTLSLGLVPNPPSPTSYVPPTKKDWDTLFQPMFDEYFNPPPSVASLVPAFVAPEPGDLTSTPSSTIIDQDTPSLSTLQTHYEIQSPVIPSSVKEEFHDIEVTHLDKDPFFSVPIPKPNSEESSLGNVIPTNVHSVNQPPEHLIKWTKDHPLDNVIGSPSRPISTRKQLQNKPMFCYFDAFLTSVEPKNYTKALKESCSIEAMQEELNEFE
ncbi:hypothetical protein Tco_0863324 [Tanacetum coccineum]